MSKSDYKLSNIQRNRILSIIKDLNESHYIYITPIIEKELGRDLLNKLNFGRDAKGKFITYGMNYWVFDNILIGILTPISEVVSKDTKEKIRKLFY